MKILLKIILVISAFKAVIVLFLLISAIIAWISGPPTSIIIPGLGLIVSMRLIVILLLVTEIFLVAIVAFIWRYISKTRLQ